MFWELKMKEGSLLSKRVDLAPTSTTTSVKGLTRATILNMSTLKNLGIAKLIYEAMNH